MPPNHANNRLVSAKSMQRPGHSEKVGESQLKSFPTTDLSSSSTVTTVNNSFPPSTPSRVQFTPNRVQSAARVPQNAQISSSSNYNQGTNQQIGQVGAYSSPYPAAYGGGYSGYGGGMYGGGMGMGMGMMGMMGGYPNAFLMGPMMFINNINYFIMSIGQIMTMLGMNSQAIMQMYHNLVQMIHQLEIAIRQSAFRRWLQRKCKKSKIFRFIIVMSSVAIVASTTRLLKELLSNYFSNRMAQSIARTITSGGSTSSSNSQAEVSYE
jgi:hypothetical protein